MFLVARARGVALLEAEARARRAGSTGRRSSRSPFRTSPRPRVGSLREVGPPAVDRAGAAEDRGRHLAERQHDRGSASASACSSASTLALVLVDVCADAPLRALDPPEVGRRDRRSPDAGGDVLDGPPDPLVLPDRASSGRAPTSCSRASTSASGCCSPLSCRNERERRHDVRVDRPGVGRQRGVARDRRRRDVRGLPGLVRDDVPRLLPSRCCCSCSS